MNIQTILRLRQVDVKHHLKEEYFKVQDYKTTTNQVKQKIQIHDPLKRSTD